MDGRMIPSPTITVSAFSRAAAAILASTLASACAASAPPTPRAPTTWEKASWEDRHQTMTFAVLPNMARAWQRFEKTEYPELTCRRCHGANAEAIAYKMPADLPPLDPARMPSASSSNAREARYAKFMTDEVVPQMLALLDAKPWDGRAGFGCFSCHPVKR